MAEPSPRLAPVTTAMRPESPCAQVGSIVLSPITVSHSCLRNLVFAFAVISVSVARNRGKFQALGG